MGIFLITRDTQGLVGPVTKVCGSKVISSSLSRGVPVC